MTLDAIRDFLGATQFAVSGASRDRSKYGNIVFRRLLQTGRTVTPINPREESIEGHLAYPNLTAMPTVPEALSIVTPPQVTRQVVSEAIEVGIRFIWMQPGAEDSQASRDARKAGIIVVDDGSCILVALSLEK
jgi:predicted CoA-binding protein